MMDGMMGGGWVMMLFGLLLFILFFGALVTGVIYLVRALSERRNSAAKAHPQGSGSTQRVLDERHARGEIHKQDYEERRRNMRS